MFGGCSRVNKGEQANRTTTQTTNVDKRITTTDLSFFELRGNVKQCVLTYDDIKETYLFDKEGTLTSYKTSYEEIVGIERDKKGRIACIKRIDVIGRDYNDIYECDEQGRIVHACCDAMPDGLAFEHQYIYDGDRLANKKGWNDGPGALEITYEYKREDTLGNWTERKKSVWIEDEDEPSESTEHRSIEYWE